MLSSVALQPGVAGSLLQTIKIVGRPNGFDEWVIECYVVARLCL